MDYFQECYSNEQQEHLTAEEFGQTFCKVCRNVECQRSALNRSRWMDRISTQEERLLINPQFANPDDAKYRDIIRDFEDRFQEATKLEISARRGDWEIPTETEINKTPPQPIQFQSTDTKPETILWEGEVPGKGYKVKLSQREEGETWSCTCPAFQFKRVGPEGCKHILDAKTQESISTPTSTPQVTPKRPPMPALPIPSAGNTSFPSQGLSIGQPATPEVDPWDKPVKSYKGTTVPVHGTVKMGSGKK